MIQYGNKFGFFKMVFFHPESFFARSFLTSIRMQRLYLLLLSATETPYPPNRLLWWFLRRYLAQGFLLIWCADRGILVITSFLLKTGTAKVWRKRIKIPKMFIFVFFFCFLGVTFDTESFHNARLYTMYWPFR